MVLTCVGSDNKLSFPGLDLDALNLLTAYHIIASTTKTPTPKLAKRAMFQLTHPFGSHVSQKAPQCSQLAVLK